MLTSAMTKSLSSCVSEKAHFRFIQKFKIIDCSQKQFDNILLIKAWSYVSTYIFYLILPSIVIRTAKRINVSKWFPKIFQCVVFWKFAIRNSMHRNTWRDYSNIFPICLFFFAPRELRGICSLKLVSSSSVLKPTWVNLRLLAITIVGVYCRK